MNELARAHRARQPHIVAAMLGADKDMAEYILLNVENTNPFTRRARALVDSGHRYYDRKKYAKLVRGAAWNLLRPFIKSEDLIEGRGLRARLVVFGLKKKGKITGRYLHLWWGWRQVI